MQRRDGKARAEGLVHKVDARKKRSCVAERLARQKNVGDKFEGGEIAGSLLFFMIDGVFGEIQARDGETVLVHRVIEERNAARDRRNADERGLCFGRFGKTETPREIARNDGDAFAEGTFEIEIAPEIVFFIRIRNGGTHTTPSRARAFRLVWVPYTLRVLRTHRGRCMRITLKAYGFVFFRSPTLFS